MSTLKVNTVLSADTPTVNITDGINVTGVSTVAALNATSIVNNTQLSHRNKVINGAVTIAQRGTSHSPGASDQKYFIDQFQHIATSGASFDATVTQSTSAPDGFSKSYKVRFAFDSLIMYSVLDGSISINFCKYFSAFTSSIFLI